LPRAVEFAYDAIVLDILPPGCSGYEVLRGSEHRVWSSVLMLCAKEGGSGKRLSRAAQACSTIGCAGYREDWSMYVRRTHPDQARHDPLRFRRLTALSPIQYLAYEVHRGVRVEEREASDCFALPLARWDERDLLAM
jgi:hypothetical protein